MEEKKRFIQEFVPGKQVTMAHIISNPRKDLCERIGVDNRGAVGIMTITPGEGSIIAADAVSKAVDVNIEFVDRFTGCFIFTGEVAAVEMGLKVAVQVLESALGFTPSSVTRT